MDDLVDILSKVTTLMEGARVTPVNHCRKKLSLGAPTRICPIEDFLVLRQETLKRSHHTCRGLGQVTNKVPY